MTSYSRCASCCIPESESSSSSSSSSGLWTPRPCRLKSVKTLMMTRTHTKSKAYARSLSSLVSSNESAHCQESFGIGKLLHGASMTLSYILQQSRSMLCKLQRKISKCAISAKIKTNLTFPKTTQPISLALQCWKRIQYDFNLNWPAYESFWLQAHGQYVISQTKVTIHNACTQ